MKGSETIHACIKSHPPPQKKKIEMVHPLPEVINCRINSETWISICNLTNVLDIKHYEVFKLLDILFFLSIIIKKWTIDGSDFLQEEYMTWTVGSRDRDITSQKLLSFYSVFLDGSGLNTWNIKIKSWLHLIASVNFLGERSKASFCWPRLGIEVSEIFRKIMDIQKYLKP